MSRDNLINISERIALDDPGVLMKDMLDQWNAVREEWLSAKPGEDSLRASYTWSKASSDIVYVAYELQRAYVQAQEDAAEAKRGALLCERALTEAWATVGNMRDGLVNLLKFGTREEGEMARRLMDRFGMEYTS